MKEHEVHDEYKIIHAEVRADSQSLVPSFQRIKKGLGGNKTIFSELRIQSQSFFAHHLRSKGSMDVLVPLGGFANLN